MVLSFKIYPIHHHFQEQRQIDEQAGITTREEERIVESKDEFTQTLVTVDNFLETRQKGEVRYSCLVLHIYMHLISLVIHIVIILLL